MGRETNKNLIQNNKENKTIFLDFLKFFSKKINKTKLIKKTKTTTWKQMKPVQSRRYKKISIWSFFILDTPTLKLDIVPNVRKQ